MRGWKWRTFLVWVLIAFFALGGVANLAGSATIREDFLRWGYPSWFNLLTGSLELAAAVLLGMWRTRRVGAALGSVVMAGAAGTLAANGEYVHALPSLVVLALLSLVFFRGAEPGERPTGSP
jgi:hypothetical protein